ncbi:MAG: nitroreductase family protein [Ruminococcaceae bacterium]|nr:nitroreductase family protein [Oscillospiraceae bacterium]
MVEELIKKTRSYRRFDSEREITDGELRAMIESARCSGSAANRQRIRFVLINKKEDCDFIFSNVAFAGYLKEWKGPTETERPKAYVVMMTQNETLDAILGMDIGIAAQSILLTATELGLGGCMIGSFKKKEVNEMLGREGYYAALIIALGKPTERVYLTDVKDGDIKYFRDENDDHAVPKYSLDELII